MEIVRDSIPRSILVHAGPFHDEPDGTPLQLGIPTLEGTMWAGVGDWIIQGVSGEYYPCKDDIFQMTYDLVLNEARTPSPYVIDAEEFVSYVAKALQEND